MRRPVSGSPSKSQSSVIGFNSPLMTAPSAWPPRGRRSIAISSRQHLRFLLIRGGMCTFLMCILVVLFRQAKNVVGLHPNSTARKSIPKQPVPPSLGIGTTAKKGDPYQTGSAAICCVAKEEEAYIDEFVDFYLALGFSHIFIYDNSDKFDLRQFGESKDPRVYVRHHPGEAQQMISFKHCAQKMATNHTWVAFFDVDEYLVLFQHDTVNDFLNEHLKEGALAINWRVVGSSGQRAYRPIPVTKRFQHRLPDATPINTHVKVIVRVEDIDFSRPVESPHYIPLKLNKTQKDTNGTVFKGPFNNPPSFEVAALYHYNSKSYKEYVQKRMRGRATVGRVEGDVDKFIKDAIAGNLPNGSVYDDIVWKTMKRMLPRYKYFDEYEDHGR